MAWLQDLQLVASAEEDIEEHIEEEMSQPAAGNMTIPQPIANTIVVGESPQFLEYNPSNGNMYVSNWDSGDVFVIYSATNKVIHTIPVGGAPNVLAYNPNNGNMYVSNLDDLHCRLILIVYSLKASKPR